MPIYEYECDEARPGCKKHFSAFPTSRSRSAAIAPESFNTYFPKSSFHLKGSGWYVTDYANKSSPNSCKPKKTESKPAQSAPAASKTEGSSDSAS